jgi:putative transposase
LGVIENGETILNNYGKVAKNQWINLKNRYPRVDFSPFIIMPNHVHGIVHIRKGAGEDIEQELFENNPLRPYTTSHVSSGSLGAIVRANKASVTYRINAIRGCNEPPYLAA